MGISDEQHSNIVRIGNVAVELDKLNQAIITCLQDIRTKWVELAALLYMFHHGKGWFIAGYDTLEEWLASPDVEISRRMFFLLTESYRELAIDRRVPVSELHGIDMTKVQAVLPAIRRGQVDWAEAVADARVLSRRDLREKYKELPPVGGTLDRSIKPDEFHYEKCPTCGQSMKVKDENP